MDPESKPLLPRLAPTRPPTAHWDFPRSVAGLALVVDFARDLGIEQATILDGVELDPLQLSDPTVLVSATAEMRAHRNLVTAAGARPALALELGRRYHVTTFGIFGYALMSSRTVREALELTLRFVDLSYIFSVPHVTITEGRVSLRLDPVDLPADLVDFLVLRDAAAIRTVLLELVPGGVPFTEVTLSMAPSLVLTDFEEAFGVQPVFNAPATVLRFDAANLDLPLPQGNPHTLQLAETMCRDVVSRRRARTGLAEDVRVWITQNIASGAHMPGAAQAMLLSQRTLRRRLAAEGVGFQALLDEVREALAEEMLSTSVLSVEDVAQRLGYAEASSFIQAFKRWKGVTPVAYQRGPSGRGADRRTDNGGAIGVDHQR